MAQKEFLTKRIAVSKANAQTVAIAAVGAFITVFCLVASNYLLGINSYQSKIMAADNKADNQLKIDVSNEKQLVSSYNKFVSQNPTIIGVNSYNKPYLYNNATVILDALPSQYDFPALVTSVDKILQSDNFNIQSIGGTDEAGTITGDQASGNPQPIAMPFSFSISGANYSSIQTLFIQLEESIRPMQIESITLSGTDSSMNLSVNAQTYFQPSKVFKIATEEIPE